MNARSSYPDSGSSEVVQAFREAHQAARDALSCLTPDELYRRLFGSEPRQLALPPPEGHP